MNDAVQDFRISALERAVAALSGSDPGGQAAAATGNAVKPAANAQQETRIAALESAVLALSNSVTLLNQQMASLTSDLQNQINAQNMITISPASSVDAAQDARLDGIDTLLQTLAQNVADYNSQMTSLISQYQSLQQRSSAQTDGFDRS